MKQYNIMYYIIGCFLLFFILSISYTSEFMNVFDAAVSGFVQSFRNDTLTKWFRFMSYIGSVDVYFPFACMLASYFLIRKRFLAGLLVFVSLYGSRYLNRALKLWYERPRPDINTLVTATGYSFPSGHAMNAAAFLGFVAYLAITEHRLVLWQKIGLIVFASCLIFSIAVSRIYLGVHYPSDILAGLAAGCSWMLMCVILHRYFRSN
jgi:membrane-associated phospholipid phosphatase